MRLFILVLALVLLPLRGWLEGAMAVEVTTAAAAQTQTHAHDAASASTPAPPPLAMADQPAEPSAHCHESQAMTTGAHDAPAHLAAAAADTHHGDDGNGSHDHGHCGLCQICHSVAMTDALQAAALSPPVRVQPQGRVPHFASALLAQADKPPIF
ncbi:hypothetical protein [uncultured Pseudacidovorax sp.]|uniref:hypothetical protein n=1 Tax=uncultured Pseudacidovorax sp. TaxID=679313 RepID=UPI0025FB2118|nr:hypothetical protein [uncultured Pseudacidovorax sp.]